MRQLDRREFLRNVGAAAALGWSGPLWIPRLASGKPVARSTIDRGPFAYGLASGDPLPTAVIIWTHIDAATPRSVRWEIATDPKMRGVVAGGEAETDASRDWTVKVDAKGLHPGTTYYYRFRLGSDSSRIGRTRTAPAGSPEAVRFAVASCQDFEHGYYHAWEHIAGNEDVDFVLFLGDYIYEYERGHDPENWVRSRRHSPKHEIVTLEDYRERYRNYRSDPHLRDAHARHPFIAVWDDHEVANDRWARDGGGAENHDEKTEGPYESRRDAAYRAYFEWMPVRPNSLPLYRTFSFGSLVDLFMLDTRSYRDRPVGSFITNPLANTDRAIGDPDRTLLGRKQRQRLERWLSNSQATWKLIGNQVMIGHLNFASLPDDVAAGLAQLFAKEPLSGSPYTVNRDGVPVNYDQWDGYQPERRQILEHIRGSLGANAVEATRSRFTGKPRIPNVVFLTGDIHTSWVHELTVNPGHAPAEAPVAVEFVGPSISTINLNELLGRETARRAPSGMRERMPGALPHRSSAPVEAVAMASNRHLRYAEFDSNGYMLVDVTPESVQTTYYFVADGDPLTPVHSPDAKVRRAAVGPFVVESGSTRVAGGVPSIPDPSSVGG